MSHELMFVAALYESLCDMRHEWRSIPPSALYIYRAIHTYKYIHINIYAYVYIYKCAPSIYTEIRGELNLNQGCLEGIVYIITYIFISKCIFFHIYIYVYIFFIYIHMYIYICSPYKYRADGGINLKSRLSRRDCSYKYIHIYMYTYLFSYTNIYL